MAVQSCRIISLAAAAAATAVGVRHEHVRGDFKIQRSRAWKEGQSMRTSTYIGDGRRRHVTHLCGCGRLGRSESRGRGSTCTSVEAHMLRCSANLPASFIVAAVCRCHGIFIQVQLRKIFAAVTAEAKKAWPVDAFEQSFFWVANFAKRLFFFSSL